MVRSQGGTKAVVDAERRPADASPKRAALIALVAVAVVSVLAAAAWWATVRLSDPPASAMQEAELTVLEQRLEAVRGAITPIGVSFAAEPASGAIEVTAYRERIAAARRLVDEVNGLEVDGAEALQVRDLIVTGGSQVLEGMDLALDALVSDEASATEPAGLQVDQGMATLQEARDLLDTLLGRPAVPQVSQTRTGTGSAS